MVYGVGAFDRVVAVSDFCAWPPPVAKLPRVGGWDNTSLERIVSLRPDLVILVDAQASLIGDKLAQLGIHMLVVPSGNLAAVFTALEQIGDAVGRRPAAAQLIAQTRTRLDCVRARVRGRPKPGVLCVVDRTPGTLRELYAATPGSYLAELIDIAGGRLVNSQSPLGYAQLSKEAIVRLNPDIIIDMVQGAKGQFAEKPGEVWRDLPEVKAVCGGRLYPVRDEHVLHASQFVADTAQQFARMIHPEAR